MLTPSAQIIDPVRISKSLREVLKERTPPLVRGGVLRAADAAAVWPSLRSEEVRLLLALAEHVQFMLPIRKEKEGAMYLIPAALR